MRAIILSIGLLGLLSVALAEDLRTEVKSTADEVCKALMNKDIAGFSKALAGKVAPDFKYYDTPTTKPMTFDQMVATMKMGLGMMSKVTTAEERLVSLKTAGDTTTAITSHTMVGRTLPDKDKKFHTMSFVGVSVDVYKKVGGTWKLSSMTWKSTEQKIDGHRQKPGM